MFIGQHPTGVMFQQMNAPIHTTQITKSWSNDHVITVMKWLARSIDFDAIFDVRCTIQKDICTRLCRSMQNRYISVLQRGGTKTDYQTFCSSFNFFSQVKCPNVTIMCIYYFFYFTS